MKNSLSRIGILILIMISTLLLLFMAQSAVACIPRTAIQKNSEKSAAFFDKHELFERVIGDLAMSEQDNYADCILLNIAYCMDASHPFHSVIMNEYRKLPNQQVNTSYSELVSHFNLGATDEYSRYWHGSLLLVRPLLCVFPITGVRIALGVLMVILFLANEVILYRNGNKDIAVIYLCGMLAVQFWMTFFSIEYVMVFILMQITLLVIQNMLKKDRKENRDIKLVAIFLVTGMLTSYLDFLTTETLTFTIPMLFAFIMFNKKQQLPEGIRKALLPLKCGIAWVSGYVVMFAVKWGMAAGVSEKTTANTLEAVSYRFTGDVNLSGIVDGTNLSPLTRVLVLMVRNIGCLFFMNTKMTTGTVVLLMCGVLLISFLMWYYYRNKKAGITRADVGIYVLLAILPYIRYMILSNHTFIHFFFTYRAQMVTICCVMWIIWESGLKYYHRSKDKRK